MKRFLLPVIALVVVTAFLVVLFSNPGGGALASAAWHRPKPTPTPSPTPVRSGGVNFQTNGNLNPGDTFCLPVQQIAGIQGGFVEGGGSSFKYPGAPPIVTQWTAYNGPTASSLQAIHTVSYSFVVMADTVPIGSFYRVCMTNITSGGRYLQYPAIGVHQRSSLPVSPSSTDSFLLLTTNRKAKQR